MSNAAEIVTEAKTYKLSAGQAIYLVGDSIELGKDGCQPSNSLCLAVGPTDDVDWSAVLDAVENHLVTRYVA